MVKIYLSEISENMDEKTFATLCSFISEEKKKKIERFHFSVDRKLSLYAELLVRILACEELRLPNRKLHFTKNDYGKPHLSGSSCWHFNISHTRSTIAVATSNNEMGIDVEKVQNAELSIAERFFTAAEKRYISENGLLTDKRFYEIWTRKEAYIKSVGKGLSIPIDTVDTMKPSISTQLQTFRHSDYVVSVHTDRTIGSITTLSEKSITEKAYSVLSGE